ncbi:MAG: magnetosome protein MamC [Chromatiales bacterium]|nr:magnetosome protein MamC [Chromatiales bacterium]
MNNSYPMQTNGMPQQSQQQELMLLLDAARNGAMVGAAGAAAANLHRMRQQQVDWQEAVRNTAKVGFTAGVATAAATAVGQMFARNPVLSVVATLATGTAVMYALNKPTKESVDE